ncbi:hypothetical protein DRQ25_13005 [Candidatus Fermentibacteria bacterium]|nr:MAG: hypothetical protein DRQ25_13005 [Candidatus Fermentibacteria bacterium]
MMENNKWLYLSFNATKEFREVCMCAYELHNTLEDTIQDLKPQGDERIKQVLLLNTKAEIFLYRYIQFMRKANFEDKSKDEAKDIETKMEGDIKKIRESITSSISIHGGRSGNTLLPYFTTLEQTLSMVYSLLTNLKIEWHNTLNYTTQHIEIHNTLSDLHHMLITATEFNILPYLQKTATHITTLYTLFSEGKLRLMQEIIQNYPELQTLHIEHEKYNTDKYIPPHDPTIEHKILEMLNTLDTRITNNINKLQKHSGGELTRAAFGFQINDEETLQKKLPESLKLIAGTITEPARFSFQKGVPLISDKITKKDDEMIAEEERKMGIS